MAHTIHTPLLGFSEKTTPNVPELSFGRRFWAATLEYAKFVTGAMLVALLCMAVYALFQGLHKTLPEAKDWLISLSIVANFAFVVLSFLAGRVIPNRKLDTLVAKLVMKELKKREITDPLQGMGHRAPQD